MKKFTATKYEENLIELVDNGELEQLFNSIEKEETFILQWVEGDSNKSEVIIGNNISSKVKNGDIKLTASQSEDK